MNKKIKKITIILATVVLSSIPCNAFANSNDATKIQSKFVNENAEVKEKNSDIEIGWKKNDDGSYCLIDGKGNYVKSNWCEVGGRWYYFNENGIMQKGWVESDGKWYCLDSNGNPKMGWIPENNHWYYLDGNGAMEIGWNKIDENWYFFNGQGEMASGWRSINNKWYYFDDSGKMLSNIAIDGYYLGVNGECR